MQKILLVLIALLISAAACSKNTARAQKEQIRAVFLTSQDGTRDLIYYYSSVQSPLKIADDIIVYTVGMRNAVKKNGNVGVLTVLGTFKENVAEFVVELASAD